MPVGIGVPGRSGELGELSWGGELAELSLFEPTNCFNVAWFLAIVTGDVVASDPAFVCTVI